MPSATFFGHSCVMLHHENHKLIIDPFLTGNDLTTIRPEDIEVSYILVTHGHSDHFGDSLTIAKQCGAIVIASFELANMIQRGGAEVHQMHIGGAHDFDFGRVKLTIAHHGGGYGDKADIYTGPPVGFLITMGGKTVYHPGDTGLFYDMRLIGELNDIDLAFLPIGDNFTMGIDDAVKAVEFLKPKRVVPIHYNTFPVIEADPQEFTEKVKNSQVIVMLPGDTIEY